MSLWMNGLCWLDASWHSGQRPARTQLPMWSGHRWRCICQKFVGNNCTQLFLHKNSRKWNLHLHLSCVFINQAQVSLSVMSQQSVFKHADLKNEHQNQLKHLSKSVYYISVNNSNVHIVNFHRHSKCHILATSSNKCCCAYRAKFRLWLT